MPTSLLSDQFENDPGYRALCAELLSVAKGTGYKFDPSCGWTRAALATTSLPPEPTTSQSTFNDSPTEELIRLVKEGFDYQSQFIADAGAAHRLMLAYLKQHVKVEQKPPTDDEIMELMPQQMRDDLANAARALAGFDRANVKAAGAMRIILNRQVVNHVRAVLARWGAPANTTREANQ